MRKCRICGKEFRERTSRQVYCSPKCNAAAHRRRDLARKRKYRADTVHTVVCKWCGKPFNTTVRTRNAVYCSLGCRMEAKRKRSKQQWEEKRQARKSTPPGFERECMMCGKTFQAFVPTAKFCPACRSGRGRAKPKTQQEPERPPKDYDRMDSKIREAMERHVSYGQLQVIAAREAARAAREVRE